MTKLISKISLFSLFGILSIFFCWILLKSPGLRVNTDLNVHLLRLDGLTHAIQRGELYPYINMDFFHGFGYASDIFYGNLFIYIGAIYRVITGGSLVAGYKVTVIIEVFLTFVFCYYAIKAMSGNKLIGIFSSILYTMSTCFFSMLSSGTFGQMSAYTLIPLALSSFYLMIYKNKNTIFILVLSMSGLLLTHILTTLIVSIILFVATIINYKAIWKDKIKLYRLCISAVSALLITAFFTLPLVEQVKSQPLIGQLIPTFYVSSVGTSLWDELGATLSNTSGLYINMVIFIIVVMRLFVFRKRIPGDGFVLTGCILVFFSTKEFPWFLFEHTVLNNIQFPSRIMVFSTFFLAVGASYYLGAFIKNHYISRNKAFLIVMLAVLLVNISLMNQYMKNEKSADRMVNLNYIQTGGREYVPVGIIARDVPHHTEKYTDNPDEMFGLNTNAINSKPLFKEIYNNAQLSHIDDGITYSHFEKNADKVSFHFNNIKSGEVSLPLIYYKGYVTEITQGNETQRFYSYAGETNLVTAKLPKGEGTVKVYYYGTYVQKVSAVVSIISFFAFLIFNIFYIVRKNFPKAVRNIEL